LGRNALNAREERESYVTLSKEKKKKDVLIFHCISMDNIILSDALPS
jgi:hypothetical protein